MDYYLVSVDQSIRSTGLTIFKNSRLVAWKIIKTEKNKNIYAEDDIIFIINEIFATGFPTNVNGKIDLVIEGLSFNAKSSKYDLMVGVHWAIRAEFRRRYPNGLIGVVPVKSWRNWFTTIEERKLAKKIYKRAPLKMVVFEKLPEDVRMKFNLYCEEEKYDETQLFDLSDSYVLGKYRLNLK